MKLLNEDYLLLEDMKSLEIINEEIEEYLIEKYELENLQEGLIGLITGYKKKGKAVWKKDKNGHYVDTKGKAIDDEGYFIDAKGRRKGGKSTASRDVEFDNDRGLAVSKKMQRVINDDGSETTEKSKR
jgi:hypothetical protein